MWIFLTTKPLLYKEKPMVFMMKSGGLRHEKPYKG